MDSFIFPSSNGNFAVKNKNAVLSVVDSAGYKHVKSYKLNYKIIPWNIFFIRGLFYLFFGGIYLFMGLIESARLSDDRKKKGIVSKVSDNLMIKASTIILTILGILSFIASAFLLGVLPAKLVFALFPTLVNVHLRGILIALFKVPIFLLMLFSLKCIPAVMEFYRFNAASNIPGKRIRHAPLNFLNFAVFSFILSFFMVSLIAVGINFFINPLLNLLIFLSCVMMSYEILNLIAKSKNKLIKEACIVTSFFVTAPPTITQEETAESAFEEANLIEKQAGRNLIDTKLEGQTAFSTVYTEVKNRLKKAKINDASDADWIIATVLKKNRAEVKLTEFVSQKDYKEILRITARRESGEPISSILGEVEFYGLKISINKNVLTPRQETELLVEEVLKKLKGKRRTLVLDIGTGSGAIAIAVKKNSNASVCAADISKAAIETAMQNAEKNEVKLDFLVSDLFKSLKKNKKYDIIVSNPPYISEKDMLKLPFEVKNFDPKLALFGGVDGLDFYRRIAKDSKRHVARGGSLLLEVGKGQAKNVAEILKAAGYTKIKTVKDYAKIDRVIIAEMDG